VRGRMCGNFVDTGRIRKRGNHSVSEDRGIL